MHPAFRLGTGLAMVLLVIPVLAGLAGTLLPAFGYLPVLGATGFSGRHFAELAAQPGIFRSMTISFAAGLVSPAIALLAVFLFIAAYAGTPFFRRLQHLVSPLLAVPHAAAAFALAFLVAPSGLIARLLSPELTGWDRPPDLLVVHDQHGLTMMAGLVIKEIPFLFLIALSALPQVDLARNRFLAASLGYGRIAGFACTAWPSIYRQIRFAIFAVIAFSSSVVDVAAILGPTTPSPLAVRILVWMSDPDLGGRHLASAGAIVQLLLTCAALAAWMVLERLGRALRNGLFLQGRRCRHDRAIALAGLALISVTTGAALVGLAGLAAWSVAGPWPFPDVLPSTFTLRGWAEAFPRIGKPLATTLLVGLSSTALATVLAIAMLWEERQGKLLPSFERLIYLPLIVPEIAFLFGLHFLLVLTGLQASLPALILAHLVFVFPYVVLSLGNHWRSFDPRHEILAAALGKSHWQILLRIRLPMMLPAVLTAAAVGFAVSVGLYLPTLILGGGRLTTVTTEAVSLAAGGNRRWIGLYGVLQLLLPLAGFLIATAVPALLFRSRRALRV